MATPRRPAGQVDPDGISVPDRKARTAAHAASLVVVGLSTTAEDGLEAARGLQSRGEIISRPTNATPGGRAFLALQRKARLAGRTTAEYLRLYALEGFLLRLAHSPHRDQFVLKGGVLLAAYELRRPTTDIDVAALQLANDVDTVRDLVTDIAATALPADLDDGLAFDIDHVTAQLIRDEDEYSGVRVRLQANLATAREPFHVDVSVGDPIWPRPADIELPRLLDDEPIHLRGYPMEMVLAEKVVTALQRGQASTRWRDFADIYLLTGTYSFRAVDLRSTIETVATHRKVEITDLNEALDGYAEIGQLRWVAWLRKFQLESELPADFADVLTALQGFADPALVGELGTEASWDPASRHWSR